MSTVVDTMHEPTPIRGSELAAPHPPMGLASKFNSSPRTFITEVKARQPRPPLHAPPSPGRPLNLAALQNSPRPLRPMARSSNVPFPTPRTRYIVNLPPIPLRQFPNKANKVPLFEPDIISPSTNLYDLDTPPAEKEDQVSDNIAHIRDIFARYSAMDGLMNFMDFSRCLKKLGVTNPNLISALYDHFDQLGEGYIDYEEIVEKLDLFLNKEHKTEAFRKCFRMFDFHGSGRITRLEIAVQLSMSDRMFQRLGINKKQIHMMDDLFRALDVNKDGVMSLSEFEEFMATRPELVVALFSIILQLYAEKQELEVAPYEPEEKQESGSKKRGVRGNLNRFAMHARMVGRLTKLASNHNLKKGVKTRKTGKRRAMIGPQPPSSGSSSPARPSSTNPITIPVEKEKKPRGKQRTTRTTTAANLSASASPRSASPRVASPQAPLSKQGSSSTASQPIMLDGIPVIVAED
eukprot:TRINITY_DN63732_c0_g3_i1.p1 TRINITY_DN63732_c0_g3~~TRINITY_DN63732_c0_g3_i1.p1  ORF type:complete len:463 (-),score=27.85 TRINITY_DN63732_c0_g3_i1:435-1823(-)